MLTDIGRVFINSNIFIHVPFAISYSLQFYSDNSSQSVESVDEQVLVCLIKLVAHHVQVMDRQRQQFAVIFLRLNRELSLQGLFVRKPRINIEIIRLNKTAYYISGPKVATLE